MCRAGRARQDASGVGAGGGRPGGALTAAVGGGPARAEAPLCLRESRGDLDAAAGGWQEGAPASFLTLPRSHGKSNLICVSG